MLVAGRLRSSIPSCKKERRFHRERNRESIGKNNGYIKRSGNEMIRELSETLTNILFRLTEIDKKDANWTTYCARSTFFLNFQDKT